MIPRRTPLKRSQKPIPRSPVRKRRSKPRRGRIKDERYLAWMAQQPCMISGKPATVHHVRFFGSCKDDRRTLPLAPEYHQIQAGPLSIEVLGKSRFEAMHGVSIEAKILEYQRAYLDLGHSIKES